jgi:uncharacterized protein YgiM (DUF1202 family)
MTRKVIVLALVLALFLCTSAALATNGTVTVMYVYTDNGQGLNVRSTAYVGNNIIGLAPYGSQVRVLRFMENGWACIEWAGIGEAYVQSRFLQWDKPAPKYNPAPVVITNAPTVAPYINHNGYNNFNNTYNNNSYNNTYAYTDTLAALNAEFRTARFVSPYTVVVRPVRASGWVNMRWAPSKDAEIITNYRSGARLTVLAETQSWYQVADPETEATGFIMKTYTTRQR